MSPSLSSGNWSSTSSWVGGVVPTSSDTAQIVDLDAGSHTLIIDTASTISQLFISQGSAAATSNFLLNIQKNLTISTSGTFEPTIGSGNSSTINIYLNPTYTGGSVTLNLSGGTLKLNSNVTLWMGSDEKDASHIYTPTISGNVTLNGGTLNVEKGKIGSSYTQAAQSSMTNLTGTGTINIGIAPYGYAQGDSAPTDYAWNSDVRLVTNGTLNITGGSLNFYVAGQVYMVGASSTLTGVTVNYAASGSTVNPVFSLARDGDQSFTTDIVLSQLTLRGRGVKTVTNTNTTSSGNIGTITIGSNVAGGSTTLLMASNLTGKSGSSFAVQGNSALPAAGSTVTFIIDTASYILDWSQANAVTFANGSNGGTVNVNWTLQGNGQFKASSFNLTGPYATNVKGNIRLIATGGNSTTNNLGNSGSGATANGTIEASTTFVYAGTAVVGTPSTLVSNRTIGGLEVDSGFLNINQAALNTGGNVTMVGGGLLINGSSAGTVTLATDQDFSQSGGSLYFTLGTSADKIISSGGTSTFTFTGGSLVLQLGTGFSYANTYTLFEGFSSGSISGLTISGYDTVNYLASLGTNGVLSFAAIPETSTVVMLGLGMLVMVLAVRNHRKVAA